MALKRKIDKAAYETLTDIVKDFYDERNGVYFLKLDASDDDDVGELRRAKDREAQENRENKRKLRELQQQIDELMGNDAKKRGDIETLEKSWKEQQAAREKEFNTALQRKNEFIEKTLVDSVAAGIANEISVAPAVLLPHVKARLVADLDGETPTTRVLDTSGKLSALTVDDLKKELLANKDFSAIMVSTKASGSGAAAGVTEQGKGSAQLRVSDSQSKSFRDMTPHEKVAVIKQIKESTR